MSETPPPFQIAVIGGGPAGTFTAHFLDKLAKQTNKPIAIHIYDDKCFACGGKSSCNMCAGIIAGPLVEKFEKEGIFIPQSVIKTRITGYQLHTGYNTLYLSTRPGKQIYSIFRGQGPLKLSPHLNSFDQFLLDQAAEKKTVSVKRQKVTGISFHTDYVEIITAEAPTARYDFVVGAFGVNSDFKYKIDYGYKPPQTTKFLQMEIKLPEAFVTEKYHGKVHMFPVYKHNIQFITLTPKADFVTLTAVGYDVNREDVVNEITTGQIYRSYLPGKIPDIKCMCRPELPVGFARKPYHHRFLVVGDACVSRFLKNGIESAFCTAEIAADAIIYHGFTKQALKKHYYNKIKKIYSRDHRWGKILYFMNRLLFITPIYTEAHIMVAKKEQINRSAPRFSNVLWGMCTGDDSYNKIFLNSLHPLLMVTIFKEILLLFLKVLFKGKSALNLPIWKFCKLLNTHRVVVIGGGPAGSACAIKLAQLAKAQKLDLEIVLFEGKDFSRHHNQCVGLLSPPLLKILKEELNLTIPDHIIRSVIKGYQLHADKEAIFLENYRSENGKTYSVRRSEFDHYLLKQVEAHGIKVYHNRVTGIEFCRDAYLDEVRIFSEGNYLNADAVVCAFGLDGEMLDALNEATENRYKKPPRVMKTYITRFEIPKEQLNQQYDKRVYAFLISAVKNVQFGAITVKDDHIVVNIAGEKAHSSHLREFLSLKTVNNILPDLMLDNMTYYRGRFPSAPSRHPYGHRYVVVGDATGWLRPLKGKGINLAVITGINAAITMINDGVSKKDMEKYKTRCGAFIQDYKYGMLVRLGLNLMLKTGLLDLMIRRAKKSPRFYQLLYDSVSAENSYKNIIKNFFKRRKK